MKMLMILKSGLKRNDAMENEKCSWCNKCRNGNDGCWTSEPKNCVRYLPLEGTYLTEIKGVIETPPEIDCNKFSQFFMNWIESMGWSFAGGFKKYEDEEVEPNGECKLD